MEGEEKQVEIESKRKILLCWNNLGQKFEGKTGKIGLCSVLSIKKDELDALSQKFGI